MSVPVADKAYEISILSSFDGDPPLGTFNSTITAATAISIPLSVWDAWKRTLTLGAFTAQGLLAEWLTLSVEVVASSGTPTKVTLWLHGADGPNAITPYVINAVDAAASSVPLVTQLNCTSTSISLSSAKDVKLYGYTDTGEVEVKFIQLTYSPK